MGATTSKQLAEYIKKETTTVGKNNTPAVNVHYKRLDAEGTPTMSVRYLVGKLGESSIEVLKGLKAGDKFVVVKQKEGEYWNLSEFTSADTYIARPKSTFTPSSSYGARAKSADNTPKSTAGVKVGAVLHDAVALAVGAGKPTVTQVEKIARELLAVSIALEKDVDSGKFTAPTTSGTEENYTNDIQTEDDIAF